MSSWVERKAAEVISREGLSPLAGAAFLAGIRETIEEAAKRCRSRYLHGEAGIAARDCGVTVLAMLADEDEL